MVDFVESANACIRAVDRVLGCGLRVGGLTLGAGGCGLHR